MDHQQQCGLPWPVTLTEVWTFAWCVENVLGCNFTDFWFQMSPSLYQAFPSWLILRKWWNWKLRPLSVPVMATTPTSCTPPTCTTSGSLPSPTTPHQTWWGCRVGLRLEAGQRLATHSWCSTSSWVCWPVWTLCWFSTGCWRPRSWASYCSMDSPSTWTSESAKVRQRGGGGGTALWLHAIPAKEADVIIRGSQVKGTFGRERNITNFVINCSALMSWSQTVTGMPVQNGVEAGPRTFHLRL